MEERYAPSFFSEIADSAQAGARRILPLAFELLEPTSVVDVGCGAGHWLAEAARLGIGDYLGIDGYAPAESLQIDARRFVTHDLSRPLTVGRRFDLVLCLEVAEHLDASAADVLVASLAGLGPAVLFSAAVPHQSGHHHLNEQWPDYWAERFAAQGLHPVDAIRPRIWADADVPWWYRQNVLLFCEPQLVERSAALREARERTALGQLPVVHPQLYLWMVNQRDRASQSSWRGVIAGLRSTVAGFSRARR